MPYHHPVLFSLNRGFSKRDDRYQPDELLERLDNSTTLLEAVPRLLAEEVEQGRLGPEQITGLLQFAEEMPASIDVAIVAAVRQALQDGYSIQITWQPAVDWELRTWAVKPETSEVRGVLNLFILSPDLEPAPA